MNDIFENLRKSGFPSIKTPIKKSHKDLGGRLFFGEYTYPKDHFCEFSAK